MLRITKRWKIRGSVVAAMPRSGRPWQTAVHTDRQIIRLTRKNPHVCQQYQSRFTTRSCLAQYNEGLLRNSCPVVDPPNSHYWRIKQHLARLQFAREYVNWDSQNRSTVLFSEESTCNIIDLDEMLRPVGRRLYPRYYCLISNMGVVMYSCGNVFLLMVWNHCIRQMTQWIVSSI